MNKAYVHFGAVRTGSTIFQIRGLEHQALLQQSGIQYPTPVEAIRDALRTSHDTFVSGNANELFDYLRHQPHSFDTFAPLLQRIVGTLDAAAKALVLSSENLMWLSDEALAFLRNGMERHFNAKVVPVFCVRDLLEHGSSWWAHTRRRRPFPLEAAEYLQTEYSNSQAEFLRKAADVFGADAVLCVRHSRQLDLWRVIARDAGIDLPKAFPGLPVRKLNRSLDADALNYLQGISRLLPDGSWAATETGDFHFNPLFNALGDMVAAASVDRSEAVSYLGASERLAVIDSLKVRFQDDLAWLNRTFHVEGGPLEIASTEERASSERAAPPDSSIFSNAILKELLTPDRRNRWMDETVEEHIRIAAIIRNSGMFDVDYYSRCLQLVLPDAEIQPETAIRHMLDYGPGIGLSPSPYFDTVWYRKMYPDIRDLNPVVHYADFGASEGRIPHPKIAESACLRLKPFGNLVGLLNLYANVPRDQVPAAFAEILSQFE